MHRQSVTSSSMRSIGYDLLSKTLEIEFQNGDIYRYHDVSENVYQELIKAPSHGKYFISNIRNRYTYEKVSITS